MCVCVGFAVVFVVVVVVFFYSLFVFIFCLYHVIFVFRSSLIDSEKWRERSLLKVKGLSYPFSSFPFSPKVMQNYDGILTIKICACTLQIQFRVRHICLDYFNGNIHSNDVVDGTCLFLSQDPDVWTWRDCYHDGTEDSSEVLHR